MSHRTKAKRVSERQHPLLRGRFKRAPAEVMKEINASIDFDRRLYAQDIVGSKAHCAMLVAQRIISKEDGKRIIKGLECVHEEIERGDFAFDKSLEDIHTHVEARLEELVGEAAGRLHTARSRNDQVATDLRLWIREGLDRLDQELRALQAALLEQAECHAATVMPGFTHLQPAQPVTFGHHLLAYVEMFGRDRGRMADCRRRLNECPLGGAALAGTSFPIDRDMTAKALGFDRPCANAMDAVAARDFVLEFLSTAAIAAVHLSRLAEEVVLWASEGFRFVTVSDAFTTGSSIMPQKRNPDAAELVRAKAGRVIGALVGTLVVLKGLALAYNKDLQEDKEPVFDAADSLALCMRATTAMIGDMKANVRAMREGAERGHTTATDLADWLVKELDLPFRRAHEVVGRLVRLAEERGCALAGLPLSTMRRVEPGITKEAYAVLGVEGSLGSRTSYGGTAPKEVRLRVAAAKERFL
ncbi:MAG: argininosuccinate lyase [Alphaproteobacteria bacterium]